MTALKKTLMTPYSRVSNLKLRDVPAEAAQRTSSRVVFSNLTRKDPILRSAEGFRFMMAFQVIVSNGTTGGGGSANEMRDTLITKASKTVQPRRCFIARPNADLK